MNNPIAHEFSLPLPGYPDLASEQLSRQIERFEANAKARAEQAAASQWKLVAIGVVSTVLSLAVLAVAAHSGLSRTERVYQEASRV